MLKVLEIPTSVDVLLCLFINMLFFGLFSDENLGVSMSSVVGILLLVVFVCSVGLWVLYAYRHPHSTSGQWLIRVS